MSDLTVPPNDPEREPVRHWAALDSQSTTCGRPRAGTGEPWTALCSATLTTPAAVDTWVPVDWCRDAWHGSADRPTGPCPTCGQTDQMDATTSNWLSDHLRRCANCDEPVAFLSSRDWCDGCEEEAASAPAEPERRTVGLEVLTDELRELAIRLARSDIRQEMAAAKVALVLRIDGTAAAVPDTDVPWAVSTPGEPVKALRGLLTEAISGKNRLEREEGRPVELLMPGADVLAALSGRPVGGYTASVPVCVEDIRAGWWVLVEEGPGVYGEASNDVLWRLVAISEQCPDPSCETRGEGGTYRCWTLALQGAPEVLHRRSYSQLKSRIPATTEVEQP